MIIIIFYEILVYLINSYLKVIVKSLSRVNLTDYEKFRFMKGIQLKLIQVELLSLFFNSVYPFSLTMTPQKILVNDGR